MVTLTKSILQQTLAGVPHGEPSRATFAALVKSYLPFASWVGFYGSRSNYPVDELFIHSYSGPLACTKIHVPRGVCGVAAISKKILHVDDVHSFPGHIACDALARSEIVIPMIPNATIWHNPKPDEIETLRSQFVAGKNSTQWVLDIDSHQPAAFSRADALSIYELIQDYFPHLTA